LSGFKKKAVVINRENLQTGKTHMEENKAYPLYLEFSVVNKEN